MRRSSMAVALALVLLAAGCAVTGGESSAGTAGAPSSSGVTQPAGAPATGDGSPATSATSATSATTSTTRPAKRPITIALGGDVHFASPLDALLRRPDTSLSALRPHLAEADLAIVNLETAITTRGAPAPKKFHFRAPPTALRALAAAGVDAVSLANNHAVDYGEQGLRDTLAAQDAAEIPIVGIGENQAEAYSPAILRAGGQRVAVLAATQVPDWTRGAWPAGPSRPGIAVTGSDDRLADAVRAARKRADAVIVYLHWGTDYTECPDGAQRRTAAALAKAGASAIVGTHAHRVQGSGWLGRAYVGYGLGNFVWWRSAEPDSRTGVLTLTVSGGRVVKHRWTPMLIGSSGVPAQPRSASERRRLLGVWQEARDCTDLASAPPG